MQGTLLRRCAIVGAIAAAFAGSASAAPTLTQAAIDEGFTLSQFASGFPITSNPCCGPLGIAFVGGTQVMVTDYPGNVRIFATDADGQTAASAPVVSTFAAATAVGLARSGNFVYMTSQNGSSVTRLNLDGTVSQANFVTGISFATGIASNPVTGMLYVGSGNGGGLWVVDPATGVKTLLAAGAFDGISVSGDGKTVYAEIGGQIVGYDATTGAVKFQSGAISGADGTEVGQGTLAGKLFVNTNFGQLWEVDLSNPTTKTLLVTGGTRGDFVTADPLNGSLLFTQTSDIWRLTPGAGGCIGAACNNTSVPEPAALALTALALLGVGFSRRQRRT